MSKPSKEQMKEAFEKADSAGDGKLTFSQMKEVIKLLASEEELAAPDVDSNLELVCNMADVNGDRMIDFEEILQLFFGDSEPDDAMKGAFRAYDTNGDGYLDKKELIEVMKLAGADPDAAMVRMTMAMADDDEDGKLNYEELCAMMG